MAALDIDEVGALATAEEIKKGGSRVMGLGVDVRDEVAVKAAIGQVVQEFGGVDVLVNSAGIMHNVSLEEETVEGWDRILDTDLKGAFLVSKHVLPHMRQRGRGAIVHIGSVTGIMGYTHLAAYCASKGGIHSLTARWRSNMRPGASASTPSPRGPWTPPDPREVFGRHRRSRKSPGVF